MPALLFKHRKIKSGGVGLLITLFLAAALQAQPAAPQSQDSPGLKTPVKFATWGIDLSDVESLREEPNASSLDIDFFSEDAFDFDVIVIAARNDQAELRKMARFLRVKTAKMQSIAKADIHFLSERYYPDLDKVIRYVAFSNELYKSKSLGCRKQILLTVLTQTQVGYFEDGGLRKVMACS